MGAISPAHIFKIFNINTSMFHVGCLTPFSTHSPAGLHPHIAAYSASLSHLPSSLLLPGTPPSILSHLNLFAGIYLPVVGPCTSLSLRPRVSPHLACLPPIRPPLPTTLPPSLPCPCCRPPPPLTTSPCCRSRLPLSLVVVSAIDKIK